MAQLEEWGVSVRPANGVARVGPAEAVQQAKTRLPFVITSATEVRTTLVIFQHVPSFSALAWQVLLTGVTSETGPPQARQRSRFAWVEVFVDAGTGRILEAFSEK